MNLIGLMCAAVVVGLPAAAWAWYGVRCEREAELAIHPPEPEPEPEPVDELEAAQDTWDGDVDPLLTWIQDLPPVRSEDGEQRGEVST